MSDIPPSESSQGQSHGPSVLELYDQIQNSRKQLTRIRFLTAICVLVMVGAALVVVVLHLKEFTQNRLATRLDDHLPEIESQVRSEFMGTVNDLRPELATVSQRLEKSAPELFDRLAEESKSLLTEMLKLPEARLQVAIKGLLEEQRQRLLKEFPGSKDKPKVDQAIKNLEHSLMVEMGSAWKKKTDPHFEVISKLEQEVGAMAGSDSASGNKVHVEKMEPNAVMELILRSLSVHTEEKQ